MENSYAEALWKMIENGMKPADAVTAMHRVLKVEGRENLLPRIAQAFERLAGRKQSRTQATLTVADSTHQDSARKAAALHGLDTKEATVHIDPTIIGGWRFEGAEELVDASYKKHLLAIYRAATSA